MTEKNFDWAAPGKEVFVTYSDYGRDAKIVIKTVERQTATQIILGDERYSKRDLTLIRARGTWSPMNPIISPLDDPKSLAAYATQRHHDFAARMQKRVSEFDKSATIEQLELLQRTINSWRIHVFGK